MKGLVIALVLLCSAACYAQQPYQLDTRSSGYVRYGERYSSSYAPRLYSGGRYLGELSTNRYTPDSVSNPYGRYGSRYSPDSVNNPHGPYGRYSARPIWIYPHH